MVLVWSPPLRRLFPYRVQIALPDIIILRTLKESLVEKMSFVNKYSVLAFWCLVLIIFISVLLLNSSGLSKPFKYPGAQVADDADNATRQPEQLNIVFLYCGRWNFLRIQLPYLYRDLRKNGGVIDRVQLTMIGYNKITLDKLINFTEAANSILMEEVFSFHFMGYIPYTQPGKSKHNQALYEKVEEITRNPFIRLFKLDDDLVYIHPKAFINMISMKKSDCGFHYFNIAGSNWRCSWLHQKYGVYKGLNPKNLTFQYDPYAECGWRRLDCAKLTLQTFLQLHYQSQLERYFFDVEHLTDRKHFSINDYNIMLDNYTDALNMKKMLESGPHEEDDELVLFLAGYFEHTTYPPCVIGKSLVVHFGYHTVNRQLVKAGYLEKFEDLVKKTKQSFHLPSELWQLLEY